MWVVFCLAVSALTSQGPCAQVGVARGWAFPAWPRPSPGSIVHTTATVTVSEKSSGLAKQLLAVAKLG